MRERRRWVEGEREQREKGDWRREGERELERGGSGERGKRWESEIVGALGVELMNNQF